jgi:Tol biopolymer transport system component
VWPGAGFPGRAQTGWGHHFQAAIFTVAPDGGRANWDTRPGQSSAVYTMRPDGSDLRAVFDDGPNTANGSGQPQVRGAFDAKYSPSGNRIVFVHFPGFGIDIDLDTINPDGTGLTTISSGPLPAVLPSWGPLAS